MIEPTYERTALAQLQREKARFQTHIKLVFEPAAHDCGVCPTAGECCTDAHFVNVHITRLEAVAMRETIEQTPRLSREEKQAVYERARSAIKRYDLRGGADSFSRTYSCPLFQPGTGCLVHRRAKPAPCIHHACYDNWEDLPPQSLQDRVEHRVEQLNNSVYGQAWAWLPTPIWLALVDPDSDGVELARLERIWATRREPQSRAHSPTNLVARRASLPILNFR
ncbi:MAG: hypothetical protein ABIP75_08090 [Pyrinomonadaceae bacterium]